MIVTSIVMSMAVLLMAAVLVRQAVAHRRQTGEVIGSMMQLVHEIKQWDDGEMPLSELQQRINAAMAQRLSSLERFRTNHTKRLNELEDRESCADWSSPRVEITDYSPSAERAPDAMQAWPDAVVVGQEIQFEHDRNRDCARLSDTEIQAEMIVEACGDKYQPGIDDAKYALAVRVVAFGELARTGAVDHFLSDNP